MNESLKLRYKELAGSQKGAHLLITGGVHGDEFEPMAAIRRLIQEFEKTSASSIKGRLTLVPVVNEPAFVRGTRTAEDGLDLARVCPGLADGANTLGVAHALSELIRAADFYIDLAHRRNGVFALAAGWLYAASRLRHIGIATKNGEGFQPPGNLGYDADQERSYAFGRPRRERAWHLCRISRGCNLRSPRRRRLRRGMPEP